ncbi:hypothetical protein HRI_000117200 [Hibiscus trionum]|nr:hypothetical protein HRI_000117200 [Hibiscus trionum]
MSSWCGWHTDHGLLTCLTCGMFKRNCVEISCPDSAAGLYIRIESGEIIKVDYSCTPEEVQYHFQYCRTVNRVTICSDKYGQPKGYAYVKFLEAEAVQEVVPLNESELHGRQLKVKFSVSPPIPSLF